MKNNKKRQATSKTILNRSKISIAVVILILTGLIMQLVNLQLINAKENRDAAANQYTNEIILPANRGVIYDRNMEHILAQSSTVKTVFIAPNYFEEGDAEIIAENLSKILNVDKGKILELAQNKKSKYQIIKRNVEEEDELKVREFIAEYEMTRKVELEDGTKRNYPYSTLASQILGFTSSDNKGLDGIELKYDFLLKGINGRTVKGVDGRGNDLALPYTSYVAPENGDNLILTLDWQIQSILEKYLKQAYEEHNPLFGTRAIIMELKTGEILAMSSYPNYDLNNRNELSEELLDDYNAFIGTDEEKAAYKSELLYDLWKNKTVSELYEPGSTFKIITTAIGLETGAFTVDTTYNCSGSIAVPGHTIKCHSGKVHGTQKVPEALVNSCNPAFVQMGLAIGGKTFYKYLNDFGYTDKTGSDILGEEKSNLLSEVQMLNQLNLSNVAFGQAMTVSMIQHLRAVSAVANGGVLTTPHLIKGTVSQNGNITYNNDYSNVRQVVSQTTANAVMTALIDSTKNASVAGYQIIAKTGTSQKMARPNAEPDKDYYISSCVAFAPAEDPQIAILVVVDEPQGGQYYGSQVAAPVVSNVLSEVLPYLKIEADKTENIPTVVLSDYRNSDVEAAKNNISALAVNIKYVIKGSGNKVITQMPRAGTVVEEGGTIILYTEPDYIPETVQIIDFSNKTYQQVLAWFKENNLNMITEGIYKKKTSDCYVVSQSISAGSAIEQGSIVTINFRYNEEIQ